MYFHNTITNFKKVKMDIDKDYTVVNKVAKVKEDWKDLQEQLYMSDMLRMFFEACETVGIDVGIDVGIGTWDCLSVVKVEGYNTWRESSFKFELLLEQYGHRLAGAEFVYKVGEGVLCDRLLIEFDVYEQTKNKDGYLWKKEKDEPQDDPTDWEEEEED